MTGKVAVRSTHNGESIDALNDNEEMISLGVSANSSAIQNVTNKVSMLFRGGNIVMSNNDELSLDYHGVFTVCFWAKFPVKAITDSVYPNKFVLVMNDGTAAIDYELPSDVLDGAWHYYIVQRDGENNITLYIDSESKKTAISNARFDLTSNSYVWVGNDNPSATGYDVAIDDLVIINTVVYSGEFANPTSYVDLSRFKKCLYIKVSTGEVFGYKEA